MSTLSEMIQKYDKKTRVGVLEVILEDHCWLPSGDTTTVWEYCTCGEICSCQFPADNPSACDGVGTRTSTREFRCDYCGSNISEWSYAMAHEFIEVVGFSEAKRQASELKESI